MQPRMFGSAAPQQHETIDHSGSGGFGGLRKRFQRMREELVVLIKNKQPLAATRPNTGVAVGGKAAILRAPYVLEASAKAGDRLRRRIDAAIIGDDDLVGRARLTEDAFNRVSNGSRAVVRRNDDADRHRANFSISTR